MKLAISNIAWEKHDDPEVFALLRKNGVQGIEIAPTKVWPDWIGATPASARDYRQQLSNEGFEVPATQAILFGKPELQLFRPEAKHALIEHIKYVSELGSALGAKVLVFGAPKNRKRGKLASNEALNYAVEIMREIGQVCSSFGVCIGWEHNPVEYGCDFITNAKEAREFVDLIDSPGVQLHLDSGGIYLSGDNISEVIRLVGPFVHYHISEPMLGPLVGGVVDHQNALKSLREISYKSWISIEMKKAEGTLLEQSIKHLVANG